MIVADRASSCPHTAAEGLSFECKSLQPEITRPTDATLRVNTRLSYVEASLPIAITLMPYAIGENRLGLQSHRCSRYISPEKTNFFSRRRDAIIAGIFAMLALIVTCLRSNGAG